MNCFRCGGAIFTPNSSLQYAGPLCSCPDKYTQLEQKGQHQGNWPPQQGLDSAAYQANRIANDPNQPRDIVGDMIQKQIEEAYKKQYPEGTMPAASEVVFKTRKDLEEARIALKEYNLKRHSIVALQTEDLSVVQERLLKVLSIETNWLVDSASNGKLTAAESTSLVNYLKLIKEIMKTDEKVADELSDVELENIANADTGSSKKDT